MSSSAYEGAPFYVRTKRPTLDIDTLSEMSSVSKLAANVASAKSKLWNRAKSLNQQQPDLQSNKNGQSSDMKSYIPAGYFKYAGYVSKDANQQVQQDRSFYDSQKFKYRFNEDHTSYLKTPSIKYEPALPPRQKNHAAGVTSDWACKPIPGEAKRWAYSTVSSLKNTAEANILTPDALARAQSSYNKKRNLDKIDHISNTQENIAS